MATKKISQLPAASTTVNAGVEVLQDRVSRKSPAALASVTAKSYVLSRSVTSPPSHPSDGDRYLIPANATGTWTGLDGKITEFLLMDAVGQWYARTPLGLLYIADTAEFVVVTSDGSIVPFSAGAGQGFTNRDAWISGHSYAAYDVLTDAGQTFLCTTGIGSSTTAPASDDDHFLLWAKRGDAGPAGSDGAQGVKGDKGDTGNTGPKGDKGDAGSQGLKGDKGDTGNSGPTGATGNAGSAGQGFTNRGAWASGQSYAAYDVVTDGGQTFLCTSPIIGITPPANDPGHFLLWAARGLTIVSTLAQAKAAFALSSSPQTMMILGRLAAGDGYGGIFTTSTDPLIMQYPREGMGFFDNAGNQWVRQIGPGGKVTSKAFCTANGVADDSAGWAAFWLYPLLGYPVHIDAGRHMVATVGTSAGGLYATFKCVFNNDLVCASPINVNLAAPGANIDGIAMNPGDEFLAPAQTTQKEVGSYVWNGAAVPATRSTWANSNGFLAYGCGWKILGGTYAGYTFASITTGTPVIDTDPLTIINLGLTTQSIGGDFDAVAITGAGPGIAYVKRNANVLSAVTATLNGAGRVLPRFTNNPFRPIGMSISGFTENGNGRNNPIQIPCSDSSGFTAGYYAYDTIGLAWGSILGTTPTGPASVNIGIPNVASGNFTLGNTISQAKAYAKYFVDTANPPSATFSGTAVSNGDVVLIFTPLNGLNAGPQIFNGVGVPMTPLSRNLTPDFATTNTSQTVTIHDVGHRAVFGGWVNIVLPVAVGGVVVQGLYQVASVVDTDHYTITAASPATSTVPSGGAVPAFTTTLHGTLVTVHLVNHGLAMGGTFNVPIATSAFNITFLGPYTVTSVTDADNFVITTASCNGATTVSENGGNALVQYVGNITVSQTVSTLVYQQAHSCQFQTRNGRGFAFVNRDDVQGIDRVGDDFNWTAFAPSADWFGKINLGNSEFEVGVYGNRSNDTFSCFWEAGDAAVYNGDYLQCETNNSIANIVPSFSFASLTLKGRGLSWNLKRAQLTGTNGSLTIASCVIDGDLFTVPVSDYVIGELDLKTTSAFLLSYGRGRIANARILVKKEFTGQGNTLFRFPTAGAGAAITAAIEDLTITGETGLTAAQLQSIFWENNAMDPASTGLFVGRLVKQNLPFCRMMVWGSGYFTFRDVDDDWDGASQTSPAGSGTIVSQTAPTGGLANFIRVTGDYRLSNLNATLITGRANGDRVTYDIVAPSLPFRVFDQNTDPTKFAAPYGAGTINNYKKAQRWSQNDDITLDGSSFPSSGFAVRGDTMSYADPAGVAFEKLICKTSGKVGTTAVFEKINAV